jgi:selenocysteine lyase/cysteine desulfurase
MMRKIDLEFVRKQFPAFSEPALQGWAFFENAGGSYPCQQVIDRLCNFYTKNKVQVNYPYPASMHAGQEMENSYQRMADYLNVKKSEIHFGPSTTQNVYVLAQAMRPMWQKGDEIIVSCQDHEANAGAWRKLANSGIEVIEWHVDPHSGLLRLQDLEKLFSKRTKMIAYPHASNIIGHINPVSKISQMAKEREVISVVDGVGFAPHGFPNLKELGADIYLFSSYKTFGPHLGVMYIRQELIRKMANQSHFFKEGITRSMLTPAGPDHAQIASVSGILDYFDLVHEHHFSKTEDYRVKNAQLAQLFHDQENALLRMLLDFLKSNNDLRIVGPSEPEQRLPIVSFVSKSKNLKKLYTDLIDHQLMLGLGHFYAVRPLMDMAIPQDPGVIRISFLHYTSQEDIEQLFKAFTAIYSS